ncbi:MAG TPA: cytidine deaminase [Polyangiaceae bacterium]|nr:cytidine deaminase [Polyangiaceae bacterium]
MSAPLSPELARLVEAARLVREHAYAPYSGFRVGAAIETPSGAVYAGANVENASYGATICAERSAVACMVAAGESAIARVAVYTEADTLSMPCGICRQVLGEFAKSATVVAAGPSGARTVPFAELLPEPFGFAPPGVGP